jgi:hypothetical protein
MAVKRGAISSTAMSGARESAAEDRGDALHPEVPTYFTFLLLSQNETASSAGACRGAFAEKDPAIHVPTSFAAAALQRFASRGVYAQFIIDLRVRVDEVKEPSISDKGVGDLCRRAWKNATAASGAHESYPDAVTSGPFVLPGQW